MDNQELQQQRREAADRIASILGTVAVDDDFPRGKFVSLIRTELEGKSSMHRDILVNSSVFGMQDEPVGVSLKIDYLSSEQAEAIAKLLASWNPATPSTEPITLENLITQKTYSVDVMICFEVLLKNRSPKNRFKGLTGRDFPSSDPTLLISTQMSWLDENTPYIDGTWYLNANDPEEAIAYIDANLRNVLSCPDFLKISEIANLGIFDNEKREWLEEYSP